MAVAILKHVIKKIQYRYRRLYCVCLRSLGLERTCLNSCAQSILIRCNQCRGNQAFPVKVQLPEKQQEAKTRSVLDFFLLNIFSARIGSTFDCLKSDADCHLCHIFCLRSDLYFPPSGFWCVFVILDGEKGLDKVCT